MRRHQSPIIRLQPEVAPPTRMECLRKLQLTSMHQHPNTMYTRSRDTMDLCQSIFQQLCSSTTTLTIYTLSIVNKLLMQHWSYRILQLSNCYPILPLSTFFNKLFRSSTNTSAINTLLLNYTCCCATVTLLLR